MCDGTPNDRSWKQVVWSPDGRTIYFGRYLVRTDGSGARRLPYIPLTAVWSPDGRRIAFASKPHWCMTGHSSVLLRRTTDIYVMNADGSGTRKLTHNARYNAEPAWSPDGRKIAFRSTRNGNRDIYVMNADGSGKRNLTRNAAWDSRPSWSPDGRKIAFVSNRDGRLEAHVMNADGSGQRSLTRPGEMSEVAARASCRSTTVRTNRGRGGLGKPPVPIGHWSGGSVRGSVHLGPGAPVGSAKALGQARTRPRAALPRCGSVCYGRPRPAGTEFHLAGKHEAHRGPHRFAKQARIAQMTHGFKPFPHGQNRLMRPAGIEPAMHCSVFTLVRSAAQHVCRLPRARRIQLRNTTAHGHVARHCSRSDMTRI